MSRCCDGLGGDSGIKRDCDQGDSINGDKRPRLSGRKGHPEQTVSIVINWLRQSERRIDRIEQACWLDKMIQKSDTSTEEGLSDLKAKVSAFANTHTLMNVASEEGHEQVVRALAKMGADLNKAGDSGETSVYIASEKGHGQVLRVLGELGADVNRANNKGWTPLYVASRYGHDQVVRSLARLGADVNQETNKGSVPMWTASKNGHKQVVLALAKLGADVNRPNRNGDTPLLIASHQGHENVVRALAQLGADVNLANKRGVTPLSMATHRYLQGVTRELILAGATAKKVPPEIYVLQDVVNQSLAKRFPMEDRVEEIKDALDGRLCEPYLCNIVAEYAGPPTVDDWLQTEIRKEKAIQDLVVKQKLVIEQQARELEQLRKRYKRG